MTKQKVHKDVIMLGMLLIALLMALALMLGYDGTLLAIVIGLLGVAIGLPINPLKK